MATMLAMRQHERAFDQAESLQVFDLRVREDQLARNPTRAGAKAVRSILEEHYVGSTLTRSEIEEIMLMVEPCRRPGLRAGGWSAPPRASSRSNRASSRTRSPGCWRG